MEIRDAIGTDVPFELREAIDSTFRDVQRSYLRRDWKAVGVDAGHLVEALRRAMDHLLFGTYKPIGKSLDAFNESALIKYRDAKGDESLRILMPRQLWALYALRNKRSMGHLGLGPALQIDANILLYGAKWAVAELIRLSSTIPIHEATGFIERIVEHQISPIWREGDIVRIVNPKVSARDQTLILLGFVGEMDENGLRQIIEYKHAANFRKILKRLHALKLIEYAPQLVRISPTGFAEAKSLVDKYSL